MILLLLAAQAAVPAAPTEPVKFSILQPVANEPCVPRGKDKAAKDSDIVVCGHPLPSQKLPINEPAERTGANPDMTGVGAMNAEGTPCNARQGGCQTGVDIFGGGTAAVRLVQKIVAPSSCCEAPGEATNIALLGKDIVKGVGKAFRKKPDKSNRVAIDLDAPPPTGRVLP